MGGVSRGHQKPEANIRRGTTMNKTSINTDRVATLDRVQPKSMGSADRRADTRAVRHVLGHLRSVPLAGLASQNTRVDAPFICG